MTSAPTHRDVAHWQMTVTACVPPLLVNVICNDYDGGRDGDGDTDTFGAAKQ